MFLDSSSVNYILCFLLSDDSFFIIRLYLFTRVFKFSFYKDASHLVSVQFSAVLFVATISVYLKEIFIPTFPAISNSSSTG